jgi:hypothetical protein
MALFALLAIQVEPEESESCPAAQLQAHSVDAVGAPSIDVSQRTLTFHPPTTPEEESLEDDPSSFRRDDRYEDVGGGADDDDGGIMEDYSSSQHVQVVQTDSGEILLVTCDPLLQEPNRSRSLAHPVCTVPYSKRFFLSVVLVILF